jgi:putative transposase
MTKSRFTDSQIIEAIRRAESGMPVQGLCRELGISQATFYKWRSKYGGMDANPMARMKELESENVRLRKVYVEEQLKAEIASEYLVKKCLGHLADVSLAKEVVRARRACVHVACETFGISE